MYNMLIRPKNREELSSFGHPDFVIYNAGAFPANKCVSAHDTTLFCIQKYFLLSSTMMLSRSQVHQGCSLDYFRIDQP